MHVWVASYPRSGNRFSRTILKSIFGVRTATVYGKPNQGETTKWEGQPDLSVAASFAENDFVKTHELPVAGDHSPAIYVLRDGRDASVSYAHYALRQIPEGKPVPRWEDMLRAIIIGEGYYFGWSKHVDAWTARTAPTVMLRYEDMSADTVGTVTQACRKLGLHPPEPSGSVPTFEELRVGNEQKLRKGNVGTWRDEMNEELEELFWTRHGATMTRLGYLRREGEERKQALRDDLRVTWEANWSNDAFVPIWETRGDVLPLQHAISDGWLRPGMSVIDIGCGKGEICAWLAGQGFNVLGVDLSSRAIEFARSLHENVSGLRFFQVDACGPDTKLGTFDAIVDRGCLHVIDAGLRADYARNVLAMSRPGSRFLLIMHCRGKSTVERRTAQVRKLFLPDFELLSVDSFDMSGTDLTEPFIGCSFRLVRC